MSVKFNPLTGNFDLVSNPNFSFDYVASGEALLIPQYQQMIVSGNLQIDGTLIIDGTLVII